MLRRQGEDDRYTVQLRVKNSTVQEGFPALAADKVLDQHLGHWPEPMNPVTTFRGIINRLHPG